MKVHKRGLVSKAVFIAIIIEFDILLSILSERSDYAREVRYLPARMLLAGSFRELMDF